MARHLYIAGKDRWRDYERGTMQIERSLTYQIDTCRFQVRGERPVEGEEVIVEDSGIGLEVVEGPQATFTGGTPTFDAGMFGQGLVVDTAAGESLGIPTAGIIDPDEGTIDVRIKPLSAKSSYFVMGISTGRFSLFFTEDGAVHWDYGPAGASIISRSGIAIQGEWVRITMRWSARLKKRQLLVNGWLVGTAGFIPPIGLPATVSVVSGHSTVINDYYPSNTWCWVSNNLLTEIELTEIHPSAVIDDLRIDRIWRKDIKPNLIWCWVNNNLPVESELMTAPLPVDEYTTLKMDFEGDIKTYRSKSERFFAGIIVKVELARIQPDKSNRLWQVDCDDYTDLIDRYLVVETYENMAADAIFKDIAAKYCPGFTTNGVMAGAPVVESTGAEFEYKYPSECFRWLCDYVGWHWQPNYYKDLSFFNATELSTPAPMALKPGGRFRFGKHSIDKQGLRNRVYVRGGTMLSDPQTVEWKADGVGRIWVLPWKPHEVSLQVGEVPMSVGIENVHEEADFDYLMNFQEKYIRCAAHTATPIEGITMSLTARQDINVITMVEDLESQAAIAAIQGGDGVYEHVIVDDSLINVEAAEAAGHADLREHANPRVKGSFETEVNGWHPGQIVSIDLPDRGVTGEYLIQKVTITPTFPNPSIWTYRVEYGGRLLGIADFLKALVSAQQKKQIVDTAILSKFVYGEDKISVTDEIDFAYTMEETKVEQSLETTALAFETVGSMLSIVCPGTWANPKYQTSVDNITWSTLQDIKPGEAVQVAYPGYVKLQADGEIRSYNWKKPMVETNAVCGFVVVG